MIMKCGFLDFKPFYTKGLEVRGKGFEPLDSFETGASVLRLRPCLATPA